MDPIAVRALSFTITNRDSIVRQRGEHLQRSPSMAPILAQLLFLGPNVPNVQYGWTPPCFASPTMHNMDSENWELYIEQFVSMCADCVMNTDFYSNILATDRQVIRIRQ